MGLLKVVRFNQIVWEKIRIAVKGNWIPLISITLNSKED